MTAPEGDTHGRPSTAGAESGSVEQKKPRVDWTDPRVPIGNAPPLPWWPLAVSGIAWLAWLGFLAAMMLSRGAGPTVS
jgi:hypothetical protein